LCGFPGNRRNRSRLYCSEQGQDRPTTADPQLAVDQFAVARFGAPASGRGLRSRQHLMEYDSADIGEWSNSFHMLPWEDERCW
jgi:hypothetical protein